MTPRGTDWLLATLIGLLSVTGVLTLISGSINDAWIFMLHGYAGFLLLIIIIVKLRRVWQRLLDPRRWDRRTGAAILATFSLGGQGLNVGGRVVILRHPL